MTSEKKEKKMKKIMQCVFSQGNSLTTAQFLLLFTRLPCHTNRSNRLNYSVHTMIVNV